MANQLEVLAVDKTLLGEGPLWLSESKQIVWVDIEGMRIHLFTPDTGVSRAIVVGQRIGAVVPANDGRMVCALQNGFHYLNLENEKLELIADPEPELPNNRFNDGKCDPSGRFWAGTMPIDGDDPVGALYRLDENGTVHKLVTGVGCSNGIGWNREQTIMYYIDTITRRIDRFDYEAKTGKIKNRQAAIHIPQEQGFPDGMTVDIEDMLWVAHWGGSCISRWNPVTGECLERVELPVSQVTSCCFGGDRLDELYITSARVGLSEKQLLKEPLAGSVFKYAPGISGMPTHVYKCE